MGAAARTQHLADPVYVTSVLGNGSICPISEIIGRRRMRLIPPDSPEGKRLLRSGRVTIVVRDGRRFSGVAIVEVFDRLAGEIEQKARDPRTDHRAVESLTRLHDVLLRQRRDFS
ncbi:MAG: hypothetical protein ACE5HD_10100 [Acidobacteriota bacterium]